jgi:tetratricopeptide (TPR) repeat protein
MRAPAVEAGRLSDLFGVTERLARQLLPPGLPDVGRLDVEQGSLPVFETYVKGLIAVTPAAQIRLLDSAVRLAPNFAPARIALWQVYTAEGNHARAASAALAVPSSSRVYRRAQFLAALSRIRLKQYDDAYQILKALVDAAPTPALYNNLGVIQARRGATPPTRRPRRARGTRAKARSSALASTSATRTLGSSPCNPVQASHADGKRFRKRSAGVSSAARARTQASSPRATSCSTRPTCE